MIPFDFRRLPDDNLLIGTLVNRAAQLYVSFGDCEDRCNHPSVGCNDDFCRKTGCQSCSANTSSSGRNNCYGCCLECSEEIDYNRSFRHAEFRREYNCQKLIYYYACRYSWKYCSEIMYALESVDLSRYGSYSVLSLGCGQSPDLMAIEQENRFDGKSISYVGYDINPYWETLQDEVFRYCRGTSNMNCHYDTVDVIESLYGSRGGFANVIVMSYLVSSFGDTERCSKAAQLFDLIIEKVLAYKGNEPVLIIANDIDHNTKARNYYNVLIRKIQHAGYHGRVTKRHFTGRNGRDYGDGSTQYDTNANKFFIPDDIRNDFNCAIQCTSAQCIIEVD